MRLRGEVHHCVVAGERLVEESRVAHVPHHELGARALDVGRVAGVRQLVQHRQPHLGVPLDDPPDKARAHEAAPAGDDHAPRRKPLDHHAPPSVSSNASITAQCRQLRTRIGAHAKTAGSWHTNPRGELGHEGPHLAL